MNIVQMVAAAAKLAKLRIGEPSTWAGAGVALVSLAQMASGPYAPVLVALAALASSLAVVLAEKSGAGVVSGAVPGAVSGDGVQAGAGNAGGG